MNESQKQGDNPAVAGGPDWHSTIESADELCDCDEQYKESQVVRKTENGTLDGFAMPGQDGTPIIVCVNCGRRFYENENQHTFGSDWLSEPDLL